MSEDFWRLVQEHAAKAAAEAAAPFCAFARTTGDAATTEVVGSVTTSQVAVWLNGVSEVAGNKQQAILTYGVSAPAAGQLWLVLLPNYRPPGVLLVRLA